MYGYYVYVYMYVYVYKIYCLWPDSPWNAHFSGTRPLTAISGNNCLLLTLCDCGLWIMSELTQVLRQGSGRVRPCFRTRSRLDLQTRHVANCAGSLSGSSTGTAVTGSLKTIEVVSIKLISHQPVSHSQSASYCQSVTASNLQSVRQSLSMSGRQSQ